MICKNIVRCADDFIPITWSGRNHNSLAFQTHDIQVITEHNSTLKRQSQQKLFVFVFCLHDDVLEAFSTNSIDQDQSAPIGLV